MGNDIYLPELATVEVVNPVTEAETYFRFKLDSGKPLGHMPGQFAEISLPGIGEAPISVSSSPTQGESFEMVVRKVGNVSGAMHNLKAGDKIGVRGPFGTHFPVYETMQGKDLLFICAGLGLVPLRSAINYVLHHRQEYGKVTILYGCKTPKERLFLDELKDWKKRKDLSFIDTVDEGDKNWKGNVGLITSLLPKINIDPANTITLVCGPPVVYKFVILELRKMHVTNETIYISLERRMKCGVGKCGHCQINNLYTCLEGPVFKYTDVANVREAI